MAFCVPQRQHCLAFRGQEMHWYLGCSNRKMTERQFTGKIACFSEKRARGGLLSSLICIKLVKLCFPFMGTRTASPRGRYGERPQRDSVWRYIWKNTTCWPATAHDVTTGVPQYKCRREDTSSAFSSSLTGLFEACRVNLVRVQFSNSTMASTSKAFRKCVDPCPRYLTPDDTHDCCVFCLGMEHARDVLEGAVCVHCERLSVRKLSSRLSLFSRKEGQPSASRDSRPTVAEARRRMKSWGSQLVVADKLERDRPLFARRPRTRVSCWIVMMRSFWHH